MIKTIYFMFFICMFAVAMVACKGKSNDDFKNVSADEFEGFIGNEQIQIVDVRTVAEYSEGHIPGSLNINVLDESFSANADESEPGTNHCRILQKRSPKPECRKDTGQKRIQGVQPGQRFRQLERVG